MTFRIPTVVLLAIAFLLASGLISFGVAFAVNEWRQSGYIDCVARAQDKLIDADEQLRANRPVVPKWPGSGASEAARDAYSQQFTQFQSEWDAGQKRWDETGQRWGDETRACH